MSKGFDHNVSVKDPKTGKIVGENHYKMNVKKNADGGSVATYEQPIGSGVFFDAAGVKIEINGDVQKEVAVDKDGKTKEEFDAEHKDSAKKAKDQK